MAGRAPSPLQILGSLSAVGGERKRVTVLFADIRNSTSLVDDVDPEVAAQRLLPAIRCMKEAVERYDGVVTRTQGDGVMAFFGAPRPNEDHAVRACLAALSMQEAVSRLGEAKLEIRVGLHTGEVVVHAVDNTFYRTYDAIGANVHLASRIEQLAEGGAVLLSRDTLAVCQQFIKTERVGLQKLRGISEPVELFKLISVRPAPVSELFRGRPELSSHIGRESAIAELDAELENTLRGKGQIVGVVGEAGVGKSRLCFEFTENCRRAGIRVYEARVLAYGRATPLQPVLELLRDYFGIKPTDPRDRARQSVIEALRGIPDERLPHILDFLGLADRSAPVEPLARKAQLLECVRSIVRSQHRAKATIVLIEDLHWIDAPSAEFVETLADAVADTTTMLVVNFRPGYTASWMQRSHYRQISVDPLGAEKEEELLAQILGADPSLLQIRRKIAERARGNPFFIEELINSLIEQGNIVGTHAHYQLARDTNSLPLPSTIEAVLSARIDRLPPSFKDVVQAASVVGREVPFDILARISGLSPTPLFDALSHLRRVEFLYQLPTHAEVLYAFRHPLIQEVAYRSLIQERRRKLHGLVADAISDQYKARLGEKAGLLAYHLEEAGRLAEAAQAHLQSAIWVGANDAKAAFNSWKKVLSLLSTEPSTQSNTFLTMVASGQIMNFGWREGMTAHEAASYFEQGSRIAVSIGNMRANALIHAAYGRILAASGSADEYVAKVRQAKTLADTSQDTSVQVTVNAILCHALRLSGHLGDALAVNAQAASSAGEIGEWDRKLLGFDVDLWLTVMKGQILVTLGRYNEARPYLDRLLQLNPYHGDLTHHLASIAYVDLAWAIGDAQLAEHHAARAVSIAEKTQSPYVHVLALAARGLSHIVGHRLDAAVVDYEHALTFARERLTGLEAEPRILAELAHAHRQRGDAGTARRMAAEAISVAGPRCARVPECLAYLVYGSSLLTKPQNLQGARVALENAQTIINTTGAAIYRPMIKDLEARLNRSVDQRPDL